MAKVVSVTSYLGVFVGAVTAERDVDESEEEKKETSTRALLELVFACSDLASGGCNTCDSVSI